MSKKFLYIFLLLLFIAFFSFLSLYLMPPSFSGKSIIVNIDKGENVKIIAQKLYNNRIIKSRNLFVFTTRLLGISKELKAGPYSFSPKNNLVTVIWKLKNGKVLPWIPAKITFPEGMSIYKMGEYLEEKELSCGKDFTKLLDFDGLAELKKEFGFLEGIKHKSLEGYLYPDTYLVDKEIKYDKLALAMVKRFEELVIPFWEEAKDDTPFSFNEIVTLASIIEKEAHFAEEREIISSVFHNRLKKNMFLAADPTIKYALEDPSKKVFYYQLRVRSPYNTYINKGLPPGPICNPSLASIKAAIFPAETGYYYFVAKKDGSHIFSSTWQEHQRAKQSVNR